MCFYDANEMACKCWKWGRFRQHCAKIYRTGETCGMKLVMNRYTVAEKCKICTKIDTKQSHIRKEEERIRRWRKEHGRSASIAKAEEDIYAYQCEIQRFVHDRDVRRGGGVEDGGYDGGSTRAIPMHSSSSTSASHPMISTSTMQRISPSFLMTSEGLIIEDHSIASSVSAITKPESKKLFDITFRNIHATTFDLSLTEVDNLSLPEFFATYSQKSGVSLASLDGFRFEAPLSSKDAITDFTVKKSDDSQSWESTKKDIARLIALARLKKPAESRYEIRVDPLFCQTNESLSDISLFSGNPSNTSNTTLDMVSTGKGKMKDINNQMARDDRKSDCIFRGHTVNEIEAVIRAKLLRLCCKDALKKLEDSEFYIKDDQDHMAHCLYKSNFRVQWSAEEFWNDQRKSGETTSLQSVIALIGRAVDAQATTVGEYTRSHWPESGQVLLDVLQRFLEDGDSDSRDFDKDFSAITRAIGVSKAESGIAVQVIGPLKMVSEIGQQLAFLGAALRTSGTGNVGRSEARISPLHAFSTNFQIKFSVNPLTETEKSCWHNLFVNPVIAYGFPTSNRADEVGLEIPLEIMAALGGASHAVEYEGGVLLKGFSSMFVPLKRTGDSIQWHFIRNEDDSRLPFWEVDGRCLGRALVGTVDLESISSTRAFLGWWGTTSTHLGTEDAKYENIDWTATKEPAACAAFSGGSIGFRSFITGDLKFSVGPKDSKLHISRTGPYQRIVKHASKTPVVLYDTEERRGWLVPSSAVIAHIAQTRHFRERFSVQQKLVRINPADPKLDTYEAAERMLSENSSTVLGEDDAGNPNFHFRDLVLGVWSILECLVDKAVKVASSAEPTLHWPIRKSLQGWEFMDIVDEVSPLRLKETLIEKTCGGWVDLATDINAIILFASGFEDIIKPAEWSLKGLCHMWRAVPKEKDYLTVGATTINKLFEQSGSRLTRKHLTSTHLQWHRGRVLFEKCHASDSSFRCTCERLQQILPDSGLTFGTVVPPGKLEEGGAVIFGQATHRLPLPVLTQPQSNSRAFYSQGNCPLNLQTNFAESRESSSPSESGSHSLDSFNSGTSIEISFENSKVGSGEGNGMAMKRLGGDDQDDESGQVKRVRGCSRGRDEFPPMSKMKFCAAYQERGSNNGQAAEKSRGAKKR